MKSSDVFEFFDPLAPGADARDLRRVPAGLVDKQTLFERLCEVLQLPGYFGFNWDALYDCLKNLEWLEPGPVVLHHDDLPRMPRSDQRTYLEILRDAVAGWLPGEDYELRVEFPESVRGEIVRLIDEDFDDER